MVSPQKTLGDVIRELAIYQKNKTKLVKCYLRGSTERLIRQLHCQKKVSLRKRH
jgi:hypothetical protein